MKKTTNIILFIVVTFHVDAGEIEERRGFFWGGGLGAGYLDQTASGTNGVDDAYGRLYMEFFGGYAINPYVSVGMEIGGWNIEPDSETYTWNPYWPPDNDPSSEPQGEGLSRILVFTRVYPYRDRGLFLKLAGGHLDHWRKLSDGTVYDEQGWTTTAGVGWDIHVSGNWSVTPTLSYSYGQTDYQTHEAITLSAGFLWHQWRGPNRFVKEPEIAYWENARNRVTRTDSKSESQYHYFY